MANAIAEGKVTKQALSDLLKGVRNSKEILKKETPSAESIAKVNAFKNELVAVLFSQNSKSLNKKLQRIIKAHDEVLSRVHNKRADELYNLWQKLNARSHLLHDGVQDRVSENSDREIVKTDLILIANAAKNLIAEIEKANYNHYFSTMDKLNSVIEGSIKLAEKMAGQSADNA